ncbi:hepcidin-like isoform X2 [Cynoglossus semilaevis]|uniref:hepcidin-like isoform X2 n=1 Tax=Cynoglossus semilaevis TaxID=244447 RepID=UPI000D62F40B|nr:hepcidin-like isoform X2 [Cynoglossus semilaevis]
MKTCRVTVAVAMMLCFIYTEVSAVPAPGVFILAKRDVANQQEELVMDESWDAFKEAAEVVPSRVREKRGCTKCCIMCCSAPGKCKQCCDCCVNPGNSRITF